MTRPIFLFLTAIASFLFGAMMFVAPMFAVSLLGILPNSQTLAVITGMGGLIIGSGFINYFLRNITDHVVLRGLLLTNIITHLLGLTADIIGITGGALTVGKMAPVELTHLFVALGSLVFLLKLVPAAKAYKIG